MVLQIGGAMVFELFLMNSVSNHSQGKTKLSELLKDKKQSMITS